MRKDLAGYLDDDSVEIPGIPSTAYPEGKTYKFASPDAKTGLFLASLADLGIKANQDGAGVDASQLELDDDKERDLMRSVLGVTLDEMISDGVSWVRIQKLNRYLFLYFAMGEEVAGVMAQRLGETQAPANRAARRAATKKTPAKSATPKVSPVGSTNRKRVVQPGVPS